MLATLAGGKIALEELHRFPNVPVKQDSALHWNIEGLFAELKTGLRKAAARQLPIASISTDSWGVDYVLYDAQGRMTSPVWNWSLAVPLGSTWVTTTPSPPLRAGASDRPSFGTSTVDEPLLRSSPPSRA